MPRRRTRRYLDLRLPSIYTEDKALIDAMTALHPTWDRARLLMQLFGAKARAMSMAVSIANGHDCGGGREPPGDVIGVAGVSLHPEANGTADCYVAAVDLAHASGRTRRVEIGSHLRLVDGWRHLDEAVEGLGRRDSPPISTKWTTGGKPFPSQFDGSCRGE